MNFQTDVAKGKELGFGGSWNNRWIFGKWEPGYIEKFNPSIEYLELYGLVIAIYAWSENLRNKRFVVFCDRLPVPKPNHFRFSMFFCFKLIFSVQHPPQKFSRVPWESELSILGYTARADEKLTQFWRQVNKVRSEPEPSWKNVK